MQTIRIQAHLFHKASTCANLRIAEFQSQYVPVRSCATTSHWQTRVKGNNSKSTEEIAGDRKDCYRPVEG